MPISHGAPPNAPFDDHVEFDLAALWAGQEVIVSGHTFLVEQCRPQLSCRVDPPHPGPRTADIAEGIGLVELRLMHAPWRGCPVARTPVPQPPLHEEQCQMDYRVETFTRDGIERIRLTHVPTGLSVEGWNYGSAFADLAAHLRSQAGGSDDG